MDFVDLVDHYRCKLSLLSSPRSLSSSPNRKRQPKNRSELRLLRQVTVTTNETPNDLSQELNERGNKEGTNLTIPTIPKPYTKTPPNDNKTSKSRNPKKGAIYYCTITSSLYATTLVQNGILFVVRCIYTCTLYRWIARTYIYQEWVL